MPTRTNSTVNRISYYDFGSPRYKSCFTSGSQYVPDNYAARDEANGTYDLYYPLLRITKSPPPRCLLVTDSSIDNVVGVYKPRAYTRQSLNTVYGYQQNASGSPVNSNLEELTVTSNFYSVAPSVNPGWDVIQGDVIVKLVGNLDVIRYVHAITIEETTAIINPFPVGTYVEYKGNIWRCRETTFFHPPIRTDVSSLFWEPYVSKSTVFTADIYSLVSQTGYLATVEDERRTFRPEDTADLVTWNASYFDG